MTTGGVGDAGFKPGRGWFEPGSGEGSFERVATNMAATGLIPSEHHELKDDGRYRVNRKTYIDSNEL